MTFFWMRRIWYLDDQPTLNCYQNIIIIIFNKKTWSIIFHESKKVEKYKYLDERIIVHQFHSFSSFSSWSNYLYWLNNFFSLFSDDSFIWILFKPSADYISLYCSVINSQIGQKRNSLLKKCYFWYLITSFLVQFGHKQRWLHSKSIQTQLH